MNSKEKTLVIRNLNNPILTADDWPYKVNSVFNPGAISLENGNTLLLCRVEDKTGKSHLTKAISQDGLRDWKIDLCPTFLPNFDDFDKWGIEDPRITYIEELKKYAIIYTSYGVSGPSVAMALTEDFTKFERRGTILPSDDKDAAIFPRRINGKWALIHRPMNEFGSNMWISYSTDLINWSDHNLLLESRHGSWWDSNKIGLSTPPIETKDGWLVLYHGVRLTSAGAIYRIGLALFELDQPEICIKRGNDWIFGPEALYERIGDVGNVVFPCGYVLLSDQDTLHIYYGAADSCIGMITGSLSSMLTWLKEQ